MKCENCGANITKRDRYCPSCGMELTTFEYVKKRSIDKKQEPPAKKQVSKDIWQKQGYDRQKSEYKPIQKKYLRGEYQDTEFQDIQDYYSEEEEYIKGNSNYRGYDQAKSDYRAQKYDQKYESRLDYGKYDKQGRYGGYDVQEDYWEYEKEEKRSSEWDYIILFLILALLVGLIMGFIFFSGTLPHM